ncbi:hypothetical protein WJX73_002100 [Symbiochloris irregularis]|uniref:Uncharacterized protein n=1 Tax=Symbiochloris irregularis TaxID=706552 RepID=A0AAW1NQ73_9CHLO
MKINPLEFADRVLEVRFACSYSRDTAHASGRARVVQAVCWAAIAWFGFQGTGKIRALADLTALLLVLEQVFMASLFFTNRQFDKHEKWKGLHFVVTTCCNMIFINTSSHRHFNSNIAHALCHGLYFAVYDQVRLESALHVHACNALFFCFCQLQARLDVPSHTITAILRDTLIFILGGAVLPIAINYHQEVQARLAYLAKNPRQTDQMLGRYWAARGRSRMAHRRE